LQRAKEESSDYRYFPEPDLVPVTFSEAQIDAVRASLGELPAALRTRLEAGYGITPYDSEVLVNQGRPLVEYYIELAAALGDGKIASNWVQQDVLRTLNEQHLAIDQFPVGPRALAELIEAVRAGRLTTGRGREVLARMIAGGQPLAAALEALGIGAVDASALEQLCGALLAANPKIVAEVREGKLKGLGLLIGLAKKQNPNVNPNQVRETCLRLIEKDGGA
jgi:aspartyl-tRNA(Asn)/glutamyl-tRNA(Gln) amidotransferase subunit B